MAESKVAVNKDGIEKGKLLSPKEYQTAYAKKLAEKRKAKK